MSDPKHILWLAQMLAEKYADDLDEGRRVYDEWIRLSAETEDAVAADRGYDPTAMQGFAQFCDDHGLDISQYLSSAELARLADDRRIEDNGP